MGIDPAGIAAAAHHALARASSPDGRSHCPSGSISTTRLWRSGFSWVWSSTVTERRLPEAPARR
jgi:predicted HAD superfamily Cof-like phosphohydrolase